MHAYMTKDAEIRVSEGKDPVYTDTWMNYVTKLEASQKPYQCPNGTYVELDQNITDEQMWRGFQEDFHNWDNFEITTYTDEASGETKKALRAIKDTCSRAQPYNLASQMSTTEANCFGCIQTEEAKKNWKVGQPSLFNRDPFRETEVSAGEQEEYIK